MLTKKIDVSREFLEERQHMTRSELAAELGCTTRTVSALRLRAGLRQRSVKAPPASISREWLEAHLWMQNKEMATLLGATEYQVNDALHAHGLYERWRKNRMAKDNGCPCGRVDPARCRELCAAGLPVLCEVKR